MPSVKSSWVREKDLQDGSAEGGTHLVLNDQKKSEKGNILVFPTKKPKGTGGEP